MKPFRWLAASLLWIVSGLLGVVGVLLCVTIVLAPVGILLLMASRRLFRLSGRLVVPRPVRHPIQESARGLEDRGQRLGRRARKRARKAHGVLPDPVADVVPKPRGRLARLVPGR
jgi:hypothetical protein